MQYAERFAMDHLSIDDEFMERMRGAFTDPEILDLTICLSAFLGLGRTLRVARDHRHVADGRLRGAIWLGGSGAPKAASRSRTAPRSPISAIRSEKAFASGAR